MSIRQCVTDALNHKATENLPYGVEFTAQALEIMKPYFGDRMSLMDKYLAYHEFWGWAEEMPDKPGHFKDVFGAVWNRTGTDRDIGVIDNPLIPDISRRDYVFPEPDEERLRREFSALAASKGERFAVAGFGFCMYERAWTLCGMQNILEAMVTDPEALEILLDEILEYNLKVIDVILQYDIDAILFGDDWGQQHGLVMGPANWRRFVKPRVKAMYDRVHAAGRFVMQHSCGDCREILGELADIGMDCYKTFQAEIYDINEIKALWGDKLAFWGGISTQTLLSHADAATVSRETERIVNVMRRDGGYIAAPTHSVTHDIPPENIEAMLEVFLKYN